jgi:hypothetical protein
MKKRSKIREFCRKKSLKYPKLNPFGWLDPGLYRTITAPLRVLPDFMIIGMQKSGSSALYDYIIKHPNVYPALRKETHYFELKKGTRWYKSYFPTVFTKFYVTKIKKQIFLTGEATPNYTFFPFSAEKIKQMVPNAKFIVIMRNPVDRTFSQYQMKVRKHQESLSFEDSLKQENNRLIREANVSDDEYYNSKNFNRFAYITRGRYAEQLEIWFKIFPKENIFTISTEELEKDQTGTMKKIFEFLNLSEYTINDLEKVFTGNYKDKINSETRKKIVEYFKPHNRKLYELIGKEFDWDK